MITTWLVSLVFFRVQSARSRAATVASTLSKWLRLCFRLRHKIGTVFMMLGIRMDIKSHEQDSNSAKISKKLMRCVTLLKWRFKMIKKKIIKMLEMLQSSKWPGKCKICSDRLNVSGLAVLQ